jgi:predicted dienelactone hydrolase
MRRVFKGVAWLVIFGVLAIGILLAALWFEHRAAVALPAPTGSFAVGRATYVWTDGTPDTLAPAPGTNRELLVWMWYPAAAGKSGAMVENYLPAPLRAVVEGERPALITRFLTRDLSKVHAHSLGNADVAQPQRPYPVVIFRAGASGEVWNYSALVEDLASHGYVVVGFDAPYRTGLVVFPDGRVIRRTPDNNPEFCLPQPVEERTRCVDRLLAAWNGDLAFVLDRLERLNASDPSGRFTGRLDTTRVGVFGHSFGGAQAAQFCHDDPRCTAAIDVDGAPVGTVIREGMAKPFMFLLSDHTSETDPESQQIRSDVRSIYDRVPPDKRLHVVIRGANHFTFSDDGAVLKSRLLRGVLRAFGRLRIDGRRQLAITAYCVRTFFDAYLKGTGTPRPEMSSSLYPEILVLD